MSRSRARGSNADVKARFKARGGCGMLWQVGVSGAGRGGAAGRARCLRTSLAVRQPECYARLVAAERELREVYGRILQCGVRVGVTVAHWWFWT